MGTTKLVQTQQASTVEIIDLTNDSDDDEKPDNATENVDGIDRESPLWFCIGRNGRKNGPYSLSLLKRLRDNSPCASMFKVWRVDQSQDNWITLEEAVANPSEN